MNKRIRKKLDKRGGFSHYRDAIVFSLILAYRDIMDDQLSRIAGKENRIMMISGSPVETVVQITRYLVHWDNFIMLKMRQIDPDYAFSHMHLARKTKPHDIKKKLKPRLKELGFEEFIYLAYMTEKMLVERGIGS